MQFNQMLEFKFTPKLIYSMSNRKTPTFKNKSFHTNCFELVLRNNSPHEEQHCSCIQNFILRRCIRLQIGLFGGGGIPKSKLKTV